MRYTYFIILLFFSVQLFAQKDLSGLQITNIRTSDYVNKGIQVKFDYLYLSHFPDSLSFAMVARLKTNGTNSIGSSKPIYFMKRPNSTSNGDRFINIPYRDIPLNEGYHELQIELEAYYQEGNNQLLGTTTYGIQQPKRYSISISISGGRVSDLNSSGQQWDPARLFSSKKEARWPDPQWWVYIESTYMDEPSESISNSFMAPSAWFNIVVLETEKVYVKLYDADGFINRDDLIGTFRILHPYESMNESLIGQNAENVSGFDIQYEKILHLVSDY